MSDIRGQAEAIDGVVKAITERTNLLLWGPPCTWKTGIARRVATVLPSLDEHAQRWLTAEYVGAGYDAGTITEQPFRAPHHTVSAAALVGALTSDFVPRFTCGDSPELRTACRCKRAVPAHLFHTLPRAIVPRAGELELARFGVLFLDDLAAFSRLAIESLGRAWRAMSVGTRPMLVASAAPCSCGWQGSTLRTCGCEPSSVGRHRDRIAEFTHALGIELTAYVRVHTLPDLRELPPGESSAAIRQRIDEARLKDR
jgi:magnesium chelatase family protein